MENKYSYQYIILFSRYEIEGDSYICSFVENYYEKFNLIYTYILNEILNDKSKFVLNEDVVIEILKSLRNRSRSHHVKKLLHEFAGAEEYIAYHAILKLLGVEELLHVFLDPYVNEIYIDKSSKPIYLDHAVFGRLRSNIMLSKEQIKNLLLYAKLRSSAILDFLTSPARFDMDSFGQKLRISVMPQKVENDLAINIRKLLTVPPYLSFIYDATSRCYIALMLSILTVRPNIVIFGETGSGKTTLASLLIHAAPRHWRIALIEDTLEIHSYMLQSKHVMRIKTLSLEEKVSRIEGLRKSIAILEMLHRTPDICFISEVHDREDAKAMFHAMASGLRVIATTHARSIEGLLERWFSIYKFPRSWLQLIDLIVHLKRVFSGNKIVRVIDAIYMPCSYSNMDLMLRFTSAHSKNTVEYSPFKTGNLRIIRIKLDFEENAIGRFVDLARVIFNIFKAKFQDVEPPVDSDERISHVFMKIITQLNELAESIRSVSILPGDDVEPLPQKATQSTQRWIEEINKILEEYGKY